MDDYIDTLLLPSARENALHSQRNTAAGNNKNPRP